MGLIRDALGQALGAGKPRTGLTGPQLPFQNKSQNIAVRRSHAVSNAQPPSYDSLKHQEISTKYIDDFDDDTCFNDGKANVRQSQQYQRHQDQSRSQYDFDTTSQRAGFRPLALPQIAPGDGQPFLRGYSDELLDRDISMEEFIARVDKISNAIIPNPEMQLLQKGANIAGYFVPGAGGLGLMAGQIAAGVGTGVGSVAWINRVLSKANLEVFLPVGLEICICRANDVAEEVGYSVPQARIQDMSPESRIAAYGDLLAPLSVVLPPAKDAGRRDPIALLGKGLSQRDNDRKSSRAQKKLAKGKTRQYDSIEEGLKWLMVREATSETLERWQKILQESEATLQQEQTQQRTERP